MSVHLQVCIRCRPFANKDKLGVIMREEADGNSSIELLDESGQPHGRWGFSKSWWSGYGYERFTDQKSQNIIKQCHMKSIDQEAVYAQVGEQMKEQFLGGHAVVMFAYGLSGSGKTFSVFGPDMVGMPEAWFNFTKPHKFWGIFPRLAYDIMTKEAPRRGGEWTMSIKYFQNVVDRILDLLSGPKGVNDDDDNDQDKEEEKLSSHARHTEHTLKKHSSSSGIVKGVEDRHINDGFHKDSHGFVDITWCRKHTIESWTDLIDTFKIANSKKAIAPTQFNPASTRGHCILVFEAEMPHPTKRGVRRAGRLYVCDLAGAEPAASVHCAQYDRVVSKDGKNVDYVYKGKHPNQAKTDELVRQGKKINLSLSEMTGFFRQMAKLIKTKKFNEKRPIPGCRTYFLGKFLKNTLMHAQTYLFAGIRPEIQYQTFTEATLAFAKNASVVKLQPKRMDSHEDNQIGLGEGAEEPHGLYAQENTLSSLHEKLKVMHDVISGRRTLSYESKSCLEQVIAGISNDVVDEDVRTKLLQLCHKDYLCATSLLTTVRYALLGNTVDSNLFNHLSKSTSLASINEEVVKEVSGEEDRGNTIGDTTSDVVNYAQKLNDALVKDRFTLNERIQMLAELEKDEVDLETGRNHSSSRSNSQSSSSHAIRPRKRKMSTMSTSTENMLFLVDHQKISTAHAVMLCSGKNACEHIIELSKRSPTDDDDLQYEDAAVYGNSTYLPFILQLLTDISNLVANGGDLGGGGNGSRGGNGGRGGIRKQLEKLTQELQDARQTKENMESMISILQDEMINSTSTMTATIQQKEAELKESEDNYNNMVEMVENLTQMNTETNDVKVKITNELKLLKTQHGHDKLLLKNEEELKQRLMKSSRLMLLWKEFISEASNQLKVKEMNSIFQQTLEKEQEKHQNATLKINDLNMNIDLLTEALTESSLSSSLEIKTLNEKLMNEQQHVHQVQENARKQLVEKEMEWTHKNQTSINDINQQYQTEIVNLTESLTQIHQLETNDMMTKISKMKKIIQESQLVRDELRKEKTKNIHCQSMLQETEHVKETMSYELNSTKDQLLLMTEQLSTTTLTMKEITTKFREEKITLTKEHQNIKNELREQKECVRQMKDLSAERLLILSNQAKENKQLQQQVEDMRVEKNTIKEMMKNQAITQSNIVLDLKKELQKEKVDCRNEAEKKATQLEEFNVKNNSHKEMIERLQLEKESATNLLKVYKSSEKEWNLQIRKLHQEKMKQKDLYRTLDMKYMETENLYKDTQSEMKQQKSLHKEELKQHQQQREELVLTNTTVQQELKDMNEQWNRLQNDAICWEKERLQAETTCTNLTEENIILSTQLNEMMQRFEDCEIQMNQANEEVIASRQHVIEVDLQTKNILEEKLLLEETLLEFEQNKKQMTTSFNEERHSDMNEKKKRQQKWQEREQDLHRSHSKLKDLERSEAATKQKLTLVMKDHDENMKTLQAQLQKEKKKAGEMKTQYDECQERLQTAKKDQLDGIRQGDEYKVQVIDQERRFDAERQQLQHQYEQIKTKMTDVTNQMKIVQEEMTELKVQLKKSKKRSSKWANEYEVLQRKYQTSMENCEFTEKQCNSVQQQLLQQQQQAEEQQTKSINDHYAIEREQTKIQQHQQTINNIEEELIEKNSMIIQYQQKSDSNARYSTLYAALQSKYAVAEERIVHILQENEEITKQLLQAKTDYSNIQVRATNMQHEKESSMKQQDELRQARDDAVVEINRLEEELSKLRQQQMIHTRKQTTYQSSLQQLEQQHSKKEQQFVTKEKQLQIQIEQLLLMKKDMVEQSVQYKAEMKSHSTDMKDQLLKVKQELITNKDHMKELNDQKIQMETETKRLEKQTIQLQRHTETIENTLRSDLQQALKEVLKTRNEITSLKETMKQANLKMKRVQDEKDNCTTEFNLMSSEYQKNEKEMMNMKSYQHEMMMKYTQDVQQLQNANTHLRNEFNDQTQKMEQMVFISENMKQERQHDHSALKNRLEQEKDKYDHLEKDMKKKQYEMNEWKMKYDHMVSTAMATKHTSLEHERKVQQHQHEQQQLLHARGVQNEEIQRLLDTITTSTTQQNELKRQHEALQQKHAILVSSPVISSQSLLRNAKNTKNMQDLRDSMDGHLLHRIQSECSTLRLQLHSSTSALKTIRHSSNNLRQELLDLKRHAAEMQSELIAAPLKEKEYDDKFLCFQKEASELHDEISHLRAQLSDATHQLLKETRQRARDVKLTERISSSSPLVSPSSPSSSRRSSPLSKTFSSPGHSDFESMEEAARLRSLERERRTTRLSMLHRRLKHSEKKLHLGLSGGGSRGSRGSRGSCGESGESGGSGGSGESGGSDKHNLDHFDMDGNLTPLSPSTIGTSKNLGNDLEDDLMDAEALARSARRRIEAIQEGILRVQESTESIAFAGKSARKKRKQTSKKR